HAMDGPENLRKAGEVDYMARFLARMIGGEAAVIAWMPILRGDDDVEAALQRVGDGDDLIAFGNSQRAAGKEIVLQVDENERAFHVALILIDASVFRLADSRSDDRLSRDERPRSPSSRRLNEAWDTTAAESAAESGDRP